MLKIITPESFENIATVSQVKLARHGSISNDMRQLRKALPASDELFQKIARVRDKLNPGEELIHLFAMGSTEATGPNRNGDGFKAANLRRTHPTFVKLAKFYRNHAHNDPAVSFGDVVDSTFNESMQRVELLARLFSTKAAADRHGARVADLEMQKLSSGKEIPVSMACNIDFDVCSYCNKKSARVADYCTGTSQGGHCKAGGLRSNIGAVVEIDDNLHHLHADNPNPAFFDISHISRGRQADRIAFVTDRIKRAAVAGITIGGGELAEDLGLVLPLHIRIQAATTKQAAEQLSQLKALADAEKNPTTDTPAPYSAAFNRAVQQSRVSIPKVTAIKLANLMRAFADEKVLLPLPQFIEMFAGETDNDVIQKVANHLPGAFTRLLNSVDCDMKLAENPFIPARTSDDAARKVASDLADTCSVSRHALIRRTQIAEIRDIQSAAVLKAAAVCDSAADSAAAKLAETYCLFKLAFLQAQDPTDPELRLTQSAVLMQN